MRLVLFCLLFIPSIQLAVAENEERPAAISDGAGLDDPTILDSVLMRFVDERGLVDYEALAANSSALDTYLSHIAQGSKEAYLHLDRNSRIALWVNAYNALTLKSIIEHYPIQASFVKSILYPKNSIRQIDGVWKVQKHTVLGESYTLDQIEHEILRAELQEARVHMALVCAAKSCPPLRQEAYRAQRLDEQFAQQARRYLASEQGLQVKDSIQVSKIFEWFAEDFLWLYPESATAKAAVQRFLLEYAPDEVRDALDEEIRVTFLDYDWTLNDQKP